MCYVGIGNLSMKNKLGIKPLTSPKDRHERQPGGRCEMDWIGVSMWAHLFLCNGRPFDGGCDDGTAIAWMNEWMRAPLLHLFFQFQDDSDDMPHLRIHKWISAVDSTDFRFPWTSQCPSIDWNVRNKFDSVFQLQLDLGISCRFLLLTRLEEEGDLYCRHDWKQPLTRDFAKSLLARWLTRRGTKG